MTPAQLKYKLTGDVTVTANKTFLAVFLGSKASPKMAGWVAQPEPVRQAKEKEGIAAWKAWVKRHEGAIVSMGGPLGTTKNVSASGIVDISNALGAFTIVTAVSHDAAAKLFEEHPHFTIFPGESVEIMPILPIPGQTERITVETAVAAPIEQVWRAYTTPADILKWNAASADWHTTNATVDLREGGTFSSRMEAQDGSMGFDFAGTYTKILPLERIEYAFGDRRAEVEFSPSINGVIVRVRFDSEPTHSIEQQRGGWQAILDNFKKHVEERVVAKNTICLWFDKDAESAARFYAATFPESSVGAIHRAPSDYPAGKAGDVLTVDFTVAGVHCLGINGGPMFTHNEAFSFQIATETQEETDHLWDAIVGNGGQESSCGWCKDKWGINWQITPRVLTEAIAAGGAESKRAFDAMMGMTKIDVAAIAAARRGQ